MSQSKVVSIGGVDYDSHTGLAVQNTQTSVRRDVRRTQSVSAKGIHTPHQRSTALNRQFVKKTASHSQSESAHTNTKSMDVRPTVKRSAAITKFAKDTRSATPTHAVVADIAPVQHPAAAKAAAIKHAAATPTARDIKHAELGKALANAKSDTSITKKSRRRSKTFNVAMASLGLLLLAGYFTYVNLPNLSVRVAAAQAGINATYPEYRPVGYHLNGPVAYQNGEVSMNFTSNSSPVGFSLNQAKSNWDSSALLEKYVNPHSSGKYATYNDAGLTIYTYGTDAAWVNGGILYTVEGDATLSNEQVRRIATSM